MAKRGPLPSSVGSASAISAATAMHWIDDPDKLDGLILTLIHNSIECEGPEDRLEYEAPPPPRPEPV